MAFFHLLDSSSRFKYMKIEKKIFKIFITLYSCVLLLLEMLFLLHKILAIFFLRNKKSLRCVRSKRIANFKQAVEIEEPKKQEGSHENLHNKTLIKDLLGIVEKANYDSS